MLLRSFGAVAGFLWLAAASSADDWPAFRGPAGNGISGGKAAPTVWSAEKNVKWKAPLPQHGNGSPVVSNGRVFVAGPEDPDGLRRSLYCFDRKDGKPLWVRTVEYGKKTPRHGDNFHSPSTPAADGKRVVVWHDSAGLYAYDFEGKELWKRDLGEFIHLWGHGASPVLHDGKVLLNCAPGKKRTFVTAIDLETGKTAWETEEPLSGDGEYRERSGKAPYAGSWCTPFVAKVGGKDQIICALPTRVVGYNPDDGKILWWCEGLRHGGGDLAYSSPVLAGDILVYVGGFGGPGIGVKLGGKGDVSASHRLWRTESNPQCIGSGVYLDGFVYMPFDGRISCLDPKTGKPVWSDRGATGGYWGSISVAGGRCYVTSRSGATVVFKPGPQKFEAISVNRLDEPSNSTPAISQGEIFLRTFKHVYCISE